MRGGMEQYMTPMGPTKLHVMPLFVIGPLEPRFSEWLVFEGARPWPQSKRSARCCRRAALPLCMSDMGHACNADTHANPHSSATLPT